MAARVEAMAQITNAVKTAQKIQPQEQTHALFAVKQRKKCARGTAAEKQLCRTEIRKYLREPCNKTFEKPRETWTTKTLNPN